jgi:hypothetical protein
VTNSVPLVEAIAALERLEAVRLEQVREVQGMLATLRAMTASLPGGRFSGMGIVAAAKLVLAEGGPHTSSALATALREGGVTTRAKDFAAFKRAVYGTLKNAPKTFRRTHDRRWALVTAEASITN